MTVLSLGLALVVSGGGSFVAGAGVVNCGRGDRCSQTMPELRDVAAAVVDAWAGVVVICDVVNDAGEMSSAVPPVIVAGSEGD